MEEEVCEQGILEGHFVQGVLFEMVVEEEGKKEGVVKDPDQLELF